MLSTVSQSAVMNQKVRNPSLTRILQRLCNNLETETLDFKNPIIKVL
mgnify:CR=1 FL=1